MVVALAVGGSFRPTVAGRAARPEVGYPAPDFDLVDLEGRPVRLSAYRGQTVFLNFWATWCPPCRTEMPEIERLQALEPDLVILGVDMGSTESSAQAVADYMAVHGYTWQVPFDGSGAVTDRYQVLSVPTSFFIDKDGIIRAKYLGPMALPTMRDLIGKAR